MPAAVAQQPWWLQAIEVVLLSDFEPQLHALQTLPADMAARFNVLPLMRENDVLMVALAEPIDAEQQHMIRFVTQCRVVAVLAAAAAALIQRECDMVGSVTGDDAIHSTPPSCP